jgi:DNA-3-methyladenine glycosylase
MGHSTLDRSFYLRQDVVQLARELLGKELHTTFDDGTTSGVITETEAYAGLTDRASHAYKGRPTTRTAPMFAQGGTAYVYLCYGIHHLFNVVTHEEGTPHAILIRAVLPRIGTDIIAQRRGGRPGTTGPGTVAQALGIRTEHSGSDLINGAIRINELGIAIPDDAIIVGPRIGVDYAGADALLPYRFRIAPSHIRSHIVPTLRSS